MKTGKNLSVLAVLTALALVSIQCNKSEEPAPSGQTAPKPATVGEGSTRPETQPPVPPEILDQSKRAHEQSAMIAVADIRSLLAAREYDNARRLAADAAKAYADTLVAAEFPPLLRQAEEGVAATAQDLAQAAGATEDVRAARHSRFLQARDAGIAAMDKPDYPTAAASFQKALQEEDDPDVREMLRQATSRTGRPRLAVAEFAVIGDVGIPDAGKAVPELMLGRFDPQRFQLVERARLASILAERNLSVAQIVENPQVLRVSKIEAVRYVVVGTVSRMGTLAVSARMVDVATGEVIQTADVVANDPTGLKNSLADLVAILQMTDEEKTNYLAFRQRQFDAMVAEDAAGQAAAEAQRQADFEAERQRIARREAEAFQRMQHDRDGMVALADVKALLAQGNYLNAVRYVRWAVRSFGDTPAARDLGDLSALAEVRYQQQLDQQRNAAQWARIQAEQAARHQRFLQFRDQGLAALASNDLLASMGLFQSALGEEDNPDVRALLDQVVRQMQRPGIAVVDFDVRGDIGLPRRDAGRSLAAVLLRQFGREDGRYRLVGRDEFVAELQRVGLSMDDAMRDPTQPKMRRLRNVVRYVVVGTASHGSINVSATLIDLNAGRAVQTAEFSAANVHALARALADTATVLQLTDAEKRAYLDQQAYTDWMAMGDAAAAAGRWEEALDAYRRAYRIRNSPEALDRMTDTARRVEDLKKVHRDYEAAMASAEAGARAGDWDKAIDFYRKALSILGTPEARAGLENTRKKLIEASRDRKRLYDAAMADGGASGRTGDWARAVDAYQQAVEIDPTDDAKAGVALARRKIAEQQQTVKRAYAEAMAEAKAAIQAGAWQKALDAFTRAAAIDNTREAASGIATARRKLAEIQAGTKLYDAAMADAKAAAQAGDWQKSLDAHTRAAAIMNTPDAQAGISLAKKRLAERQRQDQQNLYDAAMADATAHAGAGRWQEALDAYRAAYGLQKTKEAVAGITNATKMLNDAQYNKKQYDKAMADAAAAVQAGDWQKALNAYQQAGAIDRTPDAKAGADLAKKKLAAASAADQKKEYARLMTEADTAARAGDWQKALDAYTRAAAIDNTPEAQAEIANAKKKLAEAASAADQKKEYARLMREGDALARAGNWQKALDAYTRAAAIDNTPEAQAEIANAKKKLAEAASVADQKKEYTRLMREGDAAAKAGDWQKALDAYTRASEIDNTAEARKGVTNARKELAGLKNEQDKKRLYDRAMTEAKAAADAGDWKKALETYQEAARINNTAEAKAGVDLARKNLAAAASAADQKKEYARLMREGDAAAKAGNWQKALDAFTKAAAIDNTPEAQADVANAKRKLADTAKPVPYDSITCNVTGGIAGFQQKTVYAADGKFQVRDARPPRTSDGQLTETEMAELGSRVAAVNWKLVKPSYVNPKVANSMDRHLAVVIGQTTYRTVVGDAPKEKPPAPVAALLDYLGELGRRYQNDGKKPEK